ncbi:MAG TPA: glycosyltransferase, partial [Nitriliruptoraceae bacterium]|nr:glycosyltransferase [Nitriliruptoraceae bacterium]
LVLVGSPRPGGPTEQLIEELAIGDVVQVVSGLSDGELAALVGSAEIACVPSLYEGFSLPTVEAMACGTPLVASRAGAIPEVVGDDDRAAWLVAPGDAGELAHALSDLLADPDRRARMGRHGRDRAVERFSWPAVARATATAYRRAIAAAGPGGDAGPAGDAGSTGVGSDDGDT